MTRLLLLLVAVIPGAGPILLGHGLVGTLLMLGGLLGWNAVFVGSTLWQGPEGYWIAVAGWGIGPLCTLSSWWWTFAATSPRRRARRRATAERALGIAQRCYLRDNLWGARVAIQKGLAGTRDDVDLLFLAWMLARRRKQSKHAQKLLRRLQRLDVDDKWTWQVHREEATNSASRLPSAMTPPGSQSTS